MAYNRAPGINIGAEVYTKYSYLIRSISSLGSKQDSAITTLTREEEERKKKTKSTNPENNKKKALKRKKDRRQKKVGNKDNLHNPE